MKVYVVTKGRYSDYHIVAVCSTREKAEIAVKLYQTYDDDIEEWDLDAIPEFPEGMALWAVHMDRKGQVLSSQQISVEISVEGSQRWDDNTWEFNLFARDQEHAIKIANEKRAIAIASNEWPVALH